MGCCGCDNKSSVLTAAILGIIQSVIGIGLTSDSIQDITADRTDTYVQVLYSKRDTVKGLLAVFLVIQLAWLVSSVMLLFANTRGHVWGIRQWLVTCSVVIVCEVVFPCILVAITVKTLADDGLVKRTIVETSSSGGWGFTSTNITYTLFPSVLSKYVVALLAVSKAGLVTIITNIALCVFTGKRIQDIVSPTTGRVLAFAAPGPAPMIIPGQVQQPYFQSGYLYPAQGQPHYPAQGQLPYTAQGQAPYMAQGQAPYPAEQQPHSDQGQPPPPPQY